MACWRNSILINILHFSAMFNVIRSKADIILWHFYYYKCYQKRTKKKRKSALNVDFPKNVDSPSTPLTNIWSVGILIVFSSPSPPSSMDQHKALDWYAIYWNTLYMIMQYTLHALSTRIILNESDVV